MANPQQQDAIGTLDGPLLIVAGPGSGKTFCLVERTANLIESRGVAPERIMVSTFTEKAAKELKTRIAERLRRSGGNINPLDLTVGTLHSNFLDLIDEFRAHSRIRRNHTVLDQFDQQYFVYQRMTEFRAIEGLEAIIRPSANVSSWMIAEHLCSTLNKLSEEAIAPTSLAQAQSDELRVIGKAYELYMALLEQYNYIDFSTIQVEMLRLLELPELADQLASRFDFLMIDEYQDTNTIQERIVLKLAAKHSNLCVVGDDDQARKHLTLSENTNYSFAGLFYDLIQFPTFSRYLGEDVAHGSVRDSRPARNIAKFSRLLNKYEYLYNVIVLQPERLERDLTTLFNLFLRFLWDGGIDEYEDEAEYAPSGCVSLMTIHQSKGLEFPIVIVGSMDAVPRRQQSVVDDMLQAEFGDVWPLSRTWAAVEGHVEVKSLKDLTNVTFFDWDAIVYSVIDKTITFHPDYFDRVQRRILDINLQPNPNPLGNAVRALRYAHRWNARFGQTLAQHVLRQVTDKGWDNFVAGERISFSSPILHSVNGAEIPIDLAKLVTS